MAANKDSDLLTLEDLQEPVKKVKNQKDEFTKKELKDIFGDAQPKQKRVNSLKAYFNYLVELITA